MAIFKYYIIFFLIFLSTLYARTIVSKSNSFRLEETTFSNLSNWDSENHTLPLKAFVKSCEEVRKRKETKIISEELYEFKIKDLLEVCKIANTVNKDNIDDAKLFFERYFSPFLVVDSEKGEVGLFTGYYLININGSKKQNEVYKFPIYKRPKDLTDSEYYSRKEINNGVLNNRGLEIFYTDNKVDLAFLQIQGSGILNFEDGTSVFLSYDGKNNRKYISLGKILADLNYMDRKSINSISIREWLNKNPDKADEILNKNESYIFFRENTSRNIIGSHGSILTPFRSIAVDNKFMPYGFPFWLETKVKLDNEIKDLNRLVISQDTGSAIKGVVRGDIFFGSNHKAEELASYMAFKGKYYLLLPKSTTEKKFNFLRKW